MKVSTPMAWIRPVVDHIFLVDRGGVPMIHLSRGLPTGADPDLIASMFTAIVDFMNQSFHSMGHGDVRSIELEDYQVVFGRGRNILMFLLYRGWESNRLERRVAREVKALERRHAAVLEHWYCVPTGTPEPGGALRSRSLSELKVKSQRSGATFVSRQRPFG